MRRWAPALLRALAGCRRWAPPGHATQHKGPPQPRCLYNLGTIPAFSQVLEQRFYLICLIIFSVTSFQRVKANELGAAINIRAIITAREIISLLLLLLLPTSLSFPPLAPAPFPLHRCLSAWTAARPGLSCNDRGDKRREENSNPSGLLRKSEFGSTVHQRGQTAAGSDASLGSISTALPDPPAPITQHIELGWARGCGSLVVRHGGFGGTRAAAGWHGRQPGESTCRPCVSVPSKAWEDVSANAVPWVRQHPSRFTAWYPLQGSNGSNLPWIRSGAPYSRPGYGYFLGPAMGQAGGCSQKQGTAKLPPGLHSSWSAPKQYQIPGRCSQLGWKQSCNLSSQLCRRVFQIIRWLLVYRNLLVNRQSAYESEGEG